VTEGPTDVKRWGIAIAMLLGLAAAAVAATLEVPATYPTIQDAVDAAAPGDTVAVAAGEYTEQVVIASDLVLRGAGRDLTVIQAPFDLPHAVGADEDRAVVCVQEPAAAVVVRDLTIDGRGRQPASGRFVGLLFYRCGGAAEALAVTNLHESPVGAAETGIGIFANYEMQLAPATLSLVDCTVARFQKTGVLVHGPGYAATLTDLVVDSDTIVSDSVQNGIELNRVGSAMVSGCTVRDVAYDGTPRPQYTAAGLLSLNVASLELRASEFTGCQAGIYLVRTPAVVANVGVDSPAPGLSTGHGLVSVNAINLGAAGSGPEAVPVPRPVASNSVPPGRPPVGFDVRVLDCDFDGGGTVTTRGMVVRAYTAEAQNFTAERCRFTGWERGVLSLEDQAYFGAVFARLSGCLVRDNLVYGIQALSVSPLDARGCRWSAFNGPYHPVTNPEGGGDPVSDNVRFDPWLQGNLAPLPLPQSISQLDYDGAVFADTLTVEYLGGADAPLYGYSAELSWDPEVVSLISLERPIRGAFATAQIFLVLPASGSAQIDAAIGGSDPGITSGPLFTARFEAVGQPDWTASPVTLQMQYARDNQNQELSGLVTDDGLISVDMQPPMITSVTLSNESLDHTDDFVKDGDLVAVTATITDADPDFGRGGVRGIGAFIYGAPSLILPPDDYTDGVATWNPRPALISPTPDGWKLFSVEAIDLAGNATTPLISDSLFADNTPPQPASGLTATGGHNLVDLAWDDPSGTDPHYRRTVVRANRWFGYPEYAGDEPAYPDADDVGVEVYAGQATTAQQSFAADGSARDIVYYAVMAEDMAGNLGLIDAGSTARAVNYRLGDVTGAAPVSPGNGLVDIFDLTRLGNSYTRLAGETGFDPECDLAPLDQDTVGVPVPDGSVDFPELMIFATAFALDLPAARSRPGAELAATTCDLRWRRVAPTAWALVLAEPCPGLKGLHLRGDARGATLRLEAGELLRRQPGPWFLHHGRDACEAHLAVLGPGVGIVGSGELLRLVADSPLELPAPVVELRDVANRPLSSDLAGAAEAPQDLPTVFRAGNPYPNPFNPSTSIAFELPARQRVSLTVYGLDGRRVRTLLQAELPAGRHTARWDGRDHGGRPVASGTYLYRLRAGPWSATGKLELLK
jgi:hypothetical protein